MFCEFKFWRGKKEAQAMLASALTSVQLNKA
jgi:hypothetical protein